MKKRIIQIAFIGAAIIIIICSIAGAHLLHMHNKVVSIERVLENTEFKKENYEIFTEAWACLHKIDSNPKKLSSKSKKVSAMQDYAMSVIKILQNDDFSFIEDDIEHLRDSHIYLSDSLKGKADTLLSSYDSVCELNNEWRKSKDTAFGIFDEVESLISGEKLFTFSSEMDELRRYKEAYDAANEIHLKICAKYYPDAYNEYYSELVESIGHYFDTSSKDINMNDYFHRSAQFRLEFNTLSLFELAFDELVFDFNREYIDEKELTHYLSKILEVNMRKGV